MKISSFFFAVIFVSLLWVNTSFAQSYTTDSTAVFHFLVKADETIDKDMQGKRPDPFRKFFNMEQTDFIYNTYVQALSDSGGFLIYPIERLQKRDKKDKFWDYPQMMKSKAVKSKKAEYYMLINLEMTRAEIQNRISFNSKSETTTKIGILGSKKDVEKTPVELRVKFELFDSKGKAVKKIKTAVISKKSIGFEIDKALIGKLEGRSGGFTPESEAELVDLIRTSAMSVIAELNKK